VARWRERDPLLLTRATLLAAGTDAATLDEIDSRTKSDLADLAAQVLGRPVPEPSGAWTDVWSDGSWQWRN
jgi:TPP-dependent pyruvate/acetoin dehydrogenase alpha subunit